MYPPHPQSQGLINFDAPPPRKPQTELAPVPPATVALDVSGGWAPAPAASVDGVTLDDVFLAELGGAGEQLLFPYGDQFGGFGGLQDKATLELSACYFPNMAEMWAASDHAHTKPQQGLCGTLT